MKVLAVTNMYPSPDEPWFGCFVKEQIDELENLGYSMQVLPFDGRRDRLNYVRAARRLRTHIRVEDFDLIHAHYGLTGAIALTQRALPVVTTFHGSDTGYRRVQRYISWVVARRATPIFVSRRNARMLGCPTAPVVPDPVDTDVFIPEDRRAARKALGWEASGTYALFPGARTNTRKRYDLFEAAVHEAQTRVRDLRPVTLEGYSRREAAAVMNASNVTVMTSDWEGSPVAVRESLACLTPVVAVPVGDCEEVLADLPGCVVVGRDAISLGDAVVAALEADRNPLLRARAEQTSRRRVAERIAEVYERVVDRERT